MTCEVVRARLLTTADPGRLPAAVREHVSGCVGCAGFARRLARVDELLPRLPVPAPTAGVKEAFVEAVEFGPVIVRRPEPRATPAGLSAVGRAVWRSREEWQYAGGVAAVLCVGVGMWWAGTRPRAAAAAAGPRHELLAKQVKSLGLLASADTPDKRLAVWTDAAAELAAEAKRVHVAAGPADLAALDRMFAVAVTDGVVGQAERLPTLTARDRVARLKPAADALAAIEADAEATAAGAPVQSQATWKKLAKTARAGRTRLEALTRPEA